LFWPVHSLYLPLPHNQHESPEDGWNWPTGQSLHDTDPNTAYCPASHASQLAALYTPLYVPAPHCAHGPSAVRRVPGMHAGVGLPVGLALGAAVGLKVGLAVGVVVGAPVGTPVGAADGAGVGAAVGLPVGWAVGPAVGNAVGAGVGLAVGMAVGLAVGAGVGTATQIVCAMAPSVHMPAWHVWHNLYPVSSWYLPPGQWKQLFCPVQALNAPSAHRWQALPPEGWYFPIGHAVHSAD
jgi:hypothetical protein